MNHPVSHRWGLFCLIFVKAQLRTRLTGARERRKEFKVGASESNVTEHLTREGRSGVQKHQVRVSGENESAEVSWDPEW